MLVVRLLGGLTVSADDVRLGTPRGRCAALLAWLALHPGKSARGSRAPRAATFAAPSAPARTGT